MADDRLIYDAWTPLSFKRVLGTRRQPGTDWMAPQWVGVHSRRLRAYKMLRAFIDNSGREYLADDDDAVKAEHREYGDAALLSDTVRSAVLGESQEIYADGAEGETPNADAVKLQDWLREWADLERFPLKLIETERNAGDLGDGIYVLGWNPTKKRVRLRVFDPGFYFPVLTDGPEDEFPEKVHLAWEIEDGRSDTVTIRRITWEIKQREGGAISLPWNEEATDRTCHLTDATWTLNLGAKQTVDDLTGGSATYAVDESGEIRDRDLGIDFVPVIHHPNTVALLNHFGRSTISHVLQILDDLANTDSDLSKASGTTGFPPIALSGVLVKGELEYGPGSVWELGDQGKLSVLDTSNSLDALLKQKDSLLERLSVNGRVPASLLGRIKPSEVPSGVAMALSFGPLASLVDEMRLTRAEKYRLLFRFVQRIAAANKQEGVPDTWDVPVDLRFGSYLPQDETAAVERARQMAGPAGAIASLETIVQTLIDSGVPIEDIEKEVKRIESRDFDGANKLADATHSDTEVGDYLGRTVEEAPAPPVVDPNAVPDTSGNDGTTPPPPGGQNQGA